MFIIDENYAASLAVVLDRAFRKPSYYCKDGKGYFDVRMTEKEFQNALDRAACEAEEDRQRGKDLFSCYGIGVPEHKALVTRREAADGLFMQLFFEGHEHRIFLGRQEFETAGQEEPKGRAFLAGEDIADIVECTLIRNLFQYRRKGNMFYLFTDGETFGRIAGNACMIRDFLQDNTGDESEEFLLDEE